MKPCVLRFKEETLNLYIQLTFPIAENAWSRTPNQPLGKWPCNLVDLYIRTIMFSWCKTFSCYSFLFATCLTFSHNKINKITLNMPSKACFPMVAKMLCNCRTIFAQHYGNTFVRLLQNGKVVIHILSVQ